MATEAPVAPPAPETTEVPIADLQLKFFNFAPSSFFNNIFAAADEYCADGMDAMEVRRTKFFVMRDYMLDFNRSCAK
jgi:hypothetical protein